MSDKEELLKSDKMHRTIYWFRKGLRLHDNPALLKACETSNQVWPIFILDPWFVINYKVGENRWRFLKECLDDLDNSFKELNGRLFVVRGSPKDTVEKLIKLWNITQLTFEVDTEPYALQRDTEIEIICKQQGVKVVKEMSHTLYDSDKVISKNSGKPPLTYQKFQTIASKIGPPKKPVPTIAKDNLNSCTFVVDESHDSKYHVPTLEELGIEDVAKLNEVLFPGGELEALKRLEKNIKRTNWICSFEKPKTEPNSLQPSTTVLGPYLKFGCLSARTFYWKIQDIYSKAKKHSQPPVSLHGQLLWREFFYTAGYGTPNFNQMKGNQVCRQIPWDSNEVYLNAWKAGKTGYPFIDAIMTQLQREGWIHHLARHAVACFLTRGDLWISWEEGQKVFEELLLDADWFLNAGNWMWLSASAFFHQYYRVYSPIAFGKKTDKNGEYIKKYLPQLKKFPSEYIYEPWKAPLSVQKAAGCIIGQDYPKPIVDHDKIREVNIKRMKAAYDSGKSDSSSPVKKSSKTGTKRSSGKDENSPSKKTKK